MSYSNARMSISNNGPKGDQASPLKEKTAEEVVEAFMKRVKNFDDTMKREPQYKKKLEDSQIYSWVFTDDLISFSSEISTFSKEKETEVHNCLSKLMYHSAFARGMLQHLMINTSTQVTFPKEHYFHWSRQLYFQNMIQINQAELLDPITRQRIRNVNAIHVEETVLKREDSNWHAAAGNKAPLELLHMMLEYGLFNTTKKIIDSHLLDNIREQFKEHLAHDEEICVLWKCPHLTDKYTLYFESILHCILVINDNAFLAAQPENYVFKAHVGTFKSAFFDTITHDKVIENLRTNPRLKHLINTITFQFYSYDEDIVVKSLRILDNLAITDFYNKRKQLYSVEMEDAKRLVEKLKEVRRDIYRGEFSKKHFREDANLRRKLTEIFDSVHFENSLKVSGFKESLGVYNFLHVYLDLIVTFTGKNPDYVDAMQNKSKTRTDDFVEEGIAILCKYMDKNLTAKVQLFRNREWTLFETLFTFKPLKALQLLMDALRQIMPDLCISSVASNKVITWVVENLVHLLDEQANTGGEKPVQGLVRIVLLDVLELFLQRPGIDDFKRTTGFRRSVSFRIQTMFLVNYIKSIKKDFKPQASLIQKAVETKDSNQLFFMTGKQICEEFTSVKMKISLSEPEINETFRYRALALFNHSCFYVKAFGFEHFENIDQYPMYVYQGSTNMSFLNDFKDLENEGYFIAQFMSFYTKMCIFERNWAVSGKIMIPVNLVRVRNHSIPTIRRRSKEIIEIFEWWDNWKLKKDPKGESPKKQKEREYVLNRGIRETLLKYLKGILYELNPYEYRMVNLLEFLKKVEASSIVEITGDEKLTFDAAKKFDAAVDYNWEKVQRLIVRSDANWIHQQDTDLFAVIETKRELTLLKEVVEQHKESLKAFIAALETSLVRYKSMSEEVGTGSFDGRFYQRLQHDKLQTSPTDLFIDFRHKGNLTMKELYDNVQESLAYYRTLDKKEGQALKSNTSEELLSAFENASSGNLASDSDLRFLISRKAAYLREKEAVIQNISDVSIKNTQTSDTIYTILNDGKAELSDKILQTILYSIFCDLSMLFDSANSKEKGKKLDQRKLECNSLDELMISDPYVYTQIEILDNLIRNQPLRIKRIIYELISSPKNAKDSDTKRGERRGKDGSQLIDIDHHSVMRNILMCCLMFQQNIQEETFDSHLALNQQYYFLLTLFIKDLIEENYQELKIEFGKEKFNSMILLPSKQRREVEATPELEVEEVTSYQGTEIHFLRLFYQGIVMHMRKSERMDPIRELTMEDRSDLSWFVMVSMSLMDELINGPCLENLQNFDVLEKICQEQEKSTKGEIHISDTMLGILFDKLSHVNVDIFHGIYLEQQAIASFLNAYYEARSIIALEEQGLKLKFEFQFNPAQIYDQIVMFIRALYISKDRIITRGNNGDALGMMLKSKSSYATGIISHYETCEDSGDAEVVNANYIIHEWYLKEKLFSQHPSLFIAKSLLNVMQNISLKARSYKKYLEDLERLNTVFYATDETLKVDRYAANLADKSWKGQQKKPNGLVFYDFLQKISFKIEIEVGESVTKKVDFMLPPESFCLTDISKVYFRENCSIDDKSDKLLSLIDSIDSFEIEVQNNLMKYRKSRFLSLLTTEDSFTIKRRIAWTISLAANIIAVSNFEFQTEATSQPSDEWAKNTVMILILILIIFSFLDFIVWAKFSMREIFLKGKIKYRTKLANYKDLGSWEKASIFLDIYILKPLVYEPVPMSYIIYILFGSLYFKYEFFLPITLMMIISLSRTAKYVIKSITGHYDKLLFTFFLAIIFIFTFSVIIGLIFYDTFDPDNVKGVPVNEICVSFKSCFSYSLDMGLRNGGGIGEAMKSMEYDDPRFFFKFALNLMWFILINLISLNIVFGIIIDTFAELRDQSKKRRKPLLR